MFWTKSAAKRVARSKPGTIVVEATPEMFVAAIRKAHTMGLPWLYIGTAKLKEREITNEMRFRIHAES